MVSPLTLLLARPLLSGMVLRVANQLLHEKGAIRLVQLDDGRRSLEVNFEALGSPRDSYYADWYVAALRDRIAHFTFGKLSVAGTHLVTVLDIAISQVALNPLAETIESTKNKFLPGLEEFVKTRSLSAVNSPPAAGLVNAMTKEHTLAATFATLGYNDSDSTLTFYRMPPTVNLTKLKLSDLEKLEIFPVVRVDATAPILLAFCRDVVEFGRDVDTSSPEVTE